MGRDGGAGKESKAQSRSGGLSAIQLQLGSSARTAREVAAGSAFYDTLPREEKRKVKPFSEYFIERHIIHVFI